MKHRDKSGGVEQPAGWRRVEAAAVDWQCQRDGAAMSGLERPDPGLAAAKTPPPRSESAGDLTPVVTPGSRQEKSLGILTTKFVNLLQTAEGGVLDLKTAAEMLAVKQKRRIYDITNVLEGIGLIIKDSKNMIRWKGTEPDPDSAEFSERLAGIRTELIELEQEERNLDVQEATIHEKLKNIINLPANAAASYVEWSDIASLECFKNDTVLGIRGPPQTQLLVPEAQFNPEEQISKYSVYLQSRNGPIDALLITSKSTVDARGIPTKASKMVMLNPPPLDTDHILNLGGAESLSDQYVGNTTESGVSELMGSAAKKLRTAD